MNSAILSDFVSQVRTGDHRAAQVLTDLLLEHGGSLPFEGKTLIQLRERDVKRHGVEYPGRVLVGRYALVGRDTIELFGCGTTMYGTPCEPYSRTFTVGDTAEYSSYNMSYLGKIVKITPKVVTIVKGESYSSTKACLKLHHFDWRNHDFDLEKTREHNRIESMCI